MSSSNSSNNGRKPFLPTLPLSDQDLFWDDEELLSMFSTETRIDPFGVFNIDGYFPSIARCEAVEIVFKVNAFHGFTALTAVLAVNYLDKFLTSFRFQRDINNNNKPWLIHLVAIACLSLAAKVEEIHVPLLLDLQVDEAKYVFEAKTIQRMEFLILSTLKWKMHPITPLSFLNHIIRRLGLKTPLHWEFLKRCEQLLLCVISDSKSIHYLPSVLATATMMHVIDQIEPFTPIDYQDQLLSVLKIEKETVNECYKLIVEVSKRPQNNNIN
ncbi:CYCLIN D3;1 [Hibiscus trionum]|uniref:CYCLIN D31 n=1 Tax=Hibiscus trionum TaxID=183268 RepID=A0A9W7IX22_HIBTR|nr:CYCLIN D3;1 [Hibiscus trionum]